MEPFTIGDAAELAGDVGPDPRLIAVLAELDAPLDVAALRAEVGARIGTLPLLGRVLTTSTTRPAWDVVEPDLDWHITAITVDDATEAVYALLTTALPPDRPLWRLVVIEGAHTTQLAFLAHHVLLDGSTAVAVAGRLFGLETPPPVTPGRPPWFSPLGLIAGLARPTSRTSLLTPITSGFRLVSAEVDLERLRRTTRAAGATVNDAVLLAVAEGIRAVAAARGETLARVVVSVPVAGRPQSPGGRNEVGALVVSVPPPRGDDRHQLGRIAGRTRWRKMLARGLAGAPSMARLLAWLGKKGWYRGLFSRQRAITTLATNLRGPEQELILHGARVVSLTPISPALGNVATVFAAISYRGRLRITARLDRSVWPDAEVLRASVQAALDRMAADDAVGREVVRLR